MNPLSPIQITRHKPTHDEIARCAYLIWEQEGREPGRELNHWLQAHAQLRLSPRLRSGGAPQTNVGVRPAGSKAATSKLARAGTVTSAVSQPTRPLKRAPVAKAKSKTKNPPAPAS